MPADLRSRILTPAPILILLLWVLPLVACQDGSVPPPGEESPAPDYAAVQERVRQRVEAVLEAFLEERTSAVVVAAS
jgi:hypothetical protein